MRRSDAAVIAMPALDSYAGFALQADGKEMSTTMAAVRLFSNLLRDAALGPRIVPIVADEARTFGMANLFRQIGIYAPAGQLYEPEDAGSLLSYREARDGQLLEEGITEAGALSSWVAAATAYSVHGERLLPFYIFYSMFGFQRVGDLIWAAADQRARGFLIGATAGRTTLGGEGLQHQDGSSHIAAAAIPNCRAYDPAFAGELAVILDHGARSMLERNDDVFYYVTVAERELPATIAAGRSGAAGHSWSVPVLAGRSGGCGGSAAAGLGLDIARVPGGRGDPGTGICDWQRGLERYQLRRARARERRGGSLEPPAPAADGARLASAAVPGPATRRWSPRPIMCVPIRS